MDIRAREPVVLAADFPGLVAWYRERLGLEVVQLFEDGFHYAKLAGSGGVRIGVASAREMGVTPGDHAHDTVVLQLEVDDVRGFLERLREAGASLTGAASYDEERGFWFGGFADPEGNPFWVVDANCP